MADIYENVDEMVYEECNDPLPPTNIYKSEPQPESSTENDEMVYEECIDPLPLKNIEKREPQSESSTVKIAPETQHRAYSKGGKVCQYVVQWIHSVLILVLFGISVYTYLLLLPKLNESVVNGSWSQWGPWSTCSLTCGSGVTTRFRGCDSPAPSSTGTDCTGDLIEADTCNVTECPEPEINGRWSGWGPWSTCTQTCGAGVTTRFRRCDSPAPSSSGTDCTGDPMEADKCNVTRCLEPIVNGYWSKWGPWSTCSLTCGSGVTTRFRRCDSPAPSSTGTDCAGDPMEADICNLTSCLEPIVNGYWSEWGPWSTCSLTCGSGVTTRFRGCDSPAPSSTGKDCIGDPMEADSCKVTRCPEPLVNGNWSEWGSWSTCSLTCGAGVTTRFRRCDSPAPSSTGRDCTGDPMEADACEVTKCTEPAVNGNWSGWGSWSTCSLTCGAGVKTRFRRCDSPVPTVTGRDCTGDPMEADSCEVTRCPETVVNGGWSAWASWSTCSLTCGSGVKTRLRRCDSPAPSVSGNHCTGNLMDADFCKVTTCLEKQSAFTATQPSTSGSILRFTNVITNIGYDYSYSTGKFTCQYPGLYFFAVSITKVRSSDDDINDLVSANINVNGNSKVTASIDPEDKSDNGSYETSATLVIRLSAGDYVNVKGSNANRMESRSHFSGFLILSD